MIDEKGRLFGKVNIIDLIIVLVIFAVLAAGVYMFGFSGRISGELADMSASQGEILLTTRARLQPPEVVDLIEVGDKLVAKGAFQDAEVVSVDITPAAWVAWTADGEAVDTVHPLWKDVTIVIKDKGSFSDPIVKVGGQEARAGKEFIFKTQKVELPSIPLSVEFR